MSKSVWDYVVVSNTTGIDMNGWLLTGGVTFYKSDVDLNYCTFNGSRGEDTLNVVHSKFNMKDVEMRHTSYDAFDADFSDGEITGGIFQYIGESGSGGDAIDVSGTKISVKGTLIENVSDKALSVGERSFMDANDMHIANVGIAVVSKDGSHISVNKSTIIAPERGGIMAYIKKSEYGSASVEATNISFVNTEVEARSQKGSSIILNGSKIESADMDVNKLYKTIVN